MSKHLLAVLLAELSTVRVICLHCKGIVELPLDKLGTRFGEGLCRLCKHDLVPEDNPGVLADLERVLLALQAAKGVAIEFVIPQEPPAPA